MIKQTIRHFGLLLLISLMATATPAETDLTGEIGIDLASLSYKTDIKDTAWDYSASRSGSRHFVNLNLLGPIVNDHFANYAASMRLYGSYFRSTTGHESRTDYIQPGLKGFYGQATFLPEKPFPLRVYRSKADEYPIQYEPNNRSDRERLQPALSIIRRYQQDRDASGAVWQISPSETVRFLTEYKQETYLASRIYDFGEDSDIWVTFTKSPALPWDTMYTVLLNNKLPDTARIEIVNLDSIEANPGFPAMIINDLAPDFTRTVYLYPGRTEFQILSRGLNQYFNVISVDSNMVVSISYEDPAAPNDLDQRHKVFTNLLKLGNDDRRAKNETRYEYSDQREAVKNQSSYLHNFSNAVNYKLSENINSDMLFNFQENRTRIDTLSNQWNRVLMNRINVAYLKRQGLSASASHTFTRNYSFIGTGAMSAEGNADRSNDTLKSLVNNFMSRLTYPSKKYNHRIDLRNSITLMSDNNDYVNNQYTSEVANSMEMFAGGTKWQPQHILKYGYNSQENPSQKSHEIETRMALAATKSTSRLGDVRFRGEFSYRNRWDELGTDIKTRYLVDLSLIRKFGDDLRLSMMANQEWEITGGSAPSVSGSSSDSNIRYKSVYKFDVNAAPNKDINLTGSIMMITQGENSINKYGFSLNSIVPLLKIPYKTVILAESRSLAGQDPQSQFNIETSISHRIRKISLILKHIYLREQLSSETYSVHEIQGKISRQFGVF